VVRRGDTLWGIAALLLPASAADAQVQHAVARIYLANRSVLGPDPDLIFPGTHLTIPGGTP
jgi:nucleoid-associated protein YgaU